MILRGSFYWAPLAASHKKTGDRTGGLPSFTRWVKGQGSGAPKRYKAGGRGCIRQVCFRRARLRRGAGRECGEQSGSRRGVLRGTPVVPRLERNSCTPARSCWGSGSGGAGRKRLGWGSQCTPRSHPPPGTGCRAHTPWYHMATLLHRWDLGTIWIPPSKVQDTACD